MILDSIMYIAQKNIKSVSQMKCTEIGVCCSKTPYALHWNNRGKIYMYSLCCSTSDINPAQIYIMNIYALVGRALEAYGSHRVCVSECLCVSVCLSRTFLSNG